MLVLYFWGTYYTYQTSLSEMRERAKLTVSEITRNEAENLDQKLQEIRRNTDYLQTVSERLFTETTYQPENSEPIKLERADNGITYRDLNTMMDGSTIYGSSLPSSIYVAASTVLDGPLLSRLHLTEALDSHFQRTADSNPTINSTYFHTWDNTSRLYPPLANVPNIYSPYTRFTSSEFYYLADVQHNPSRETLWTDAYLHPTSKNWILSSITPVYRRGFLEGVVGVDITLKDFTADLLSESLLWESIPLIIQNNGNALGVSPQGQKLLNLSLPAGSTHSTRTTRGAKFPAPHNLFNHSLFTATRLQKFVSGKEQSACCVWLNGAEYLLSQHTIAETGWRLVFLTPMSKVTQQVTEHLSFLKTMGISFILLTLAFFAGLFMYLKVQATGLAKRVSRPVEVVTDYISRLNKIGNNKPLPVMQVGIRELDRLISSGNEIQLARSRLSQLNEELAQKNDQLQTLATTDSLTGLYNRHRLDEMLTHELNKARRDGSTLSLALLDIDHFKRINDTYGHHVGDDVLESIAKVMTSCVRRTDLVGRWGGEEFMILLPDTTIENAAIVLDQMRKQISRSNFHPVLSVTVSLGLAGSNMGETAECIAGAADKALYLAKHNGRNRLELADGPGGNSEASVAAPVTTPTTIA